MDKDTKYILIGVIAIAAAVYFGVGKSGGSGSGDDKKKGE